MKTQRVSYFQGAKLYPMCMLGHHIQGALAGTAILLGGVSWIVLACVWTALYISYQGLSVIRKKDSAGLDMADYISGMGIGVIVTSIFGLF